MKQMNNLTKEEIENLKTLLTSTEIENFALGFQIAYGRMSFKQVASFFKKHNIIYLLPIYKKGCTLDTKQRIFVRKNVNAILTDELKRKPTNWILNAKRKQNIYQWGVHTDYIKQYIDELKSVQRYMIEQQLKQ